MSRLLAMLLLVASVVAAQAQVLPPGPADRVSGFPAATSAPPIPAPIEDAARTSAEALFAEVTRLYDDAEITVLIDPLIDGITGFETVATRRMNRQMVEIAAQKFPRIKVLPLTVENLGRARLLIIGTFNPINNAGNPAGVRDAYWLCFAAIDLAKRTVAARAVNRVRPDGVDSTPAALFARSPVWSVDAATRAYIEACQRSNPGDPVDPAYIANLALRVATQEGQAALEAGRIEEAQSRFAAAAAMAGGAESVAVNNGLYLALAELGRTADALQTVTRLIDNGLKQDRLGLLFLFETSSTAFVRDAAVSGAYAQWLRALSERVLATDRCLEVIGHASRTGVEAGNVRLSQARAAAIIEELRRLAPTLAARLAASGAGSSRPLVGLPVDDAQTAVDKRVEIRPVACGPRRT